MALAEVVDVAPKAPSQRPGKGRAGRKDPKQDRPLPLSLHPDAGINGNWLHREGVKHWRPEDLEDQQDEESLRDRAATHRHREAKPVESDLELAVRTRREMAAGCVLVRDGKVLAIGRGRGVLPVLHVIDATADVQGASLADSVVGRAAALLALASSLKSVYGEIMSASAVRELDRAGHTYRCGQLVDHIKDRTGTRECPFERLTAPCSQPAEALARLREAAESGLASTLARYGMDA